MQIPTMPVPGQTKVDQVVQVAAGLAPLVNMILLFFQMRQSRKNGKRINEVKATVNGDTQKSPDRTVQ